MAARRSTGHNVKISDATYARMTLAALELGKHIGDCTEQALMAWLDRHDRLISERRYKAGCQAAAARREPTPLRSDFQFPGLKRDR
jgi:hypothetical protein